ncbi:MAG: hypothetical protein IKK11_05160, partial [Oscillospiraceae bacterium]|nr:hypothetical protein [Oscillospiraceae bacterium]
MKNNRNLPSGQTPISGILIGVLVALFVSFLLSVGLTSLLLNKSTGEWPENFSSFIIRMISVLSGCLVGTAIYKEKTIITTGILTAIYFVILLIIGTIVYNSVFRKMGMGLVSV